MKIAIISDIHSNCYALNAVLRDIKKLKVSDTILLGDIFGYYPWAVETYELVIDHKMTVIQGNHDALVYRKKVPVPCPSYWDAAKDNESALRKKYPKAIPWLKSLKFKGSKSVEGIKLVFCHGTPDDPKEGRLYPDNIATFDWLPKKNEVLLLGHTHYPMERRLKQGGMVLNPGSVGQPRDGNPMPSWCILESDDLSVSWQRTKYDYRKAVRELRKMSWNARFIESLQKTSAGPLRFKS